MTNKEDKLIYLFLIIPVIWVALLIAPIIDKGLIGIVNEFPKVIEKPFEIKLCDNSLKTTVISIIIYAFGIFMFDSNSKNYRYSEEHGSAKWGNVFKIGKKYSNKNKSNNKLLSDNFKLSLNTKQHQRNLNVLLIGGSGSGKTRTYVLPNLLQSNTSYVVLDSKGEISRTTAGFLKQQGYDVKFLDLTDPDSSHCYNPFVYFRNDLDIQKFAEVLFKSTNKEKGKSSDPFWNSAGLMLFSALTYLLYYEAPKYEQNLGTLIEILKFMKVKEEDEDYESPVDILFSRLEIKNPNHIALKYYKDYKLSAGKTAKSINITLAAILQKFNVENIDKMTRIDEMDFRSWGDKKTVLFALISDVDKSMNFLVSILYTQLFQELFSMADKKYNGELPIHVHFLMDEFANVALPPDFDNILSVMRSRNISVSIILQNLSQLKKLYKDEWESIVGNCDSIVYLGGNEKSTHEYISGLLGKETIDINNFGKTTGNNGNYSTNYQTQGRELMMPDEVRKLDNKYCLIFERGENPIKDQKFNLFKHPNYCYTSFVTGKHFKHGEDKYSTSSIQLVNDDDIDINIIDRVETNTQNSNIELLFDDELIKYLRKEEKDYE